MPKITDARALRAALESALSCETAVLDPEDSGALTDVLLTGPIAPLLAALAQAREALDGTGFAELICDCASDWPADARCVPCTARAALAAIDALGGE